MLVNRKTKFVIWDYKKTNLRSSIWKHHWRGSVKKIFLLYLKETQTRYCPVKFAKFLRTPILKSICERLLLSTWNWLKFRSVTKTARAWSLELFHAFLDSQLLWTTLIPTLTIENDVNVLRCKCPWSGAKIPKLEMCLVCYQQILWNLLASEIKGNDLLKPITLSVHKMVKHRLNVL